MSIRSLLRIYCQIRFVQYLLQFLANALIPDHDAHVFNPPSWSLSNANALDACVERLFFGLRRWDAVHYLHIARFGYIYENSLAFFPGYPLILVRPLAVLFHHVLLEPNAYLLSGVLVNFLLGFANACLIYHLALKYHLTANHAYWSSVLFMVNPATVFFLAPYSEAMFLFSQLCAHYFLQSHRTLLSSLCFAFGCTIRSNGIVSFGFIIYYYLRRKRLFPVHHLLLCVASFALTQYYLYREYCFAKTISPELQAYGAANDLGMPLSDFSSAWCVKRIPLSYQYVQQRYWNVGFLRYYTWKQIPNFLLALPVFALVGRFALDWFRLVRDELWQRKFAFLFASNDDDQRRVWFTTKDFLPHVVYTLFLTCFALTFMHIQVATRFLFSSGPLLYLICADRLKRAEISNGNLRKTFYLFKRETCLFYYYTTYVIVGICLFSNFLPWT